MKSATRTDWKIQPLPAQHVTLALNHAFTPAEMHAIRLGFIPRDIDDRWFIFFENDILYMHRSWTGHCILVADLTESDGAYIVSRLHVNRDPEQYRATDDAADISLFLQLITNFLLHRSD